MLENEIKQQVEKMASLDIDSDIATDRDDFALSGALSRESLEIEHKLIQSNIIILPDENDLEVWHVYVDGIAWQNFNTAEWEWMPIERIVR